MLLNYLDVGKIKSQHWYMVELRSEKTSEETIKRIGRSMKDIFQKDPAQIFVPVMDRDLDTFVLMTESYVFVRSDDVTRIAKLRRVTGVQAIMAQNDSTRPTKFIKVDDEYVQGLITQCRENHQRRSDGIVVGSWVRIIDGETRDMCGSVITVAGDRLVVKIDMKTKPVMVETSVYNLVDLSHLPQAHRVFYYSGPVQEFLKEQGLDAENQIAQDLKYSEDSIKAFLGQDGDLPDTPRRQLTEVYKNSREHTPTRLIRGLINEGHHDVHEILDLVVKAIRSKVIKAPKTATILWHVLRQTVIHHMFPGDPDIRIYSDILKKYGEAYNLTPKDVLRAIPELALKSEHLVKSAPEITLLPPVVIPEVQAAVVEVRTTLIEVPVAPKGVWTTVSGLVRSFLLAGDYDMFAAVAKIEEEIRASKVRAPKHLEALAGTIRYQILKHFRTSRPGSSISTLALDHPKLRIYPTVIREALPGLETLLEEKRVAQASRLSVVTTLLDPVLAPTTPRKPKDIIIPVTLINLP